MVSVKTDRKRESLGALLASIIYKQVMYRLGHSQHEPITTAEQGGVCVNPATTQDGVTCKKRKLNLADVSNPVVRFRVRSDKWLLSVGIHQEDTHTTDASPLCRPTTRVVEKRHKGSGEESQDIVQL